jgi:Tol biopolymer transport system component
MALAVVAASCNASAASGPTSSEIAPAPVPYGCLEAAPPAVSGPIEQGALEGTVAFIAGPDLSNHDAWTARADGSSPIDLSGSVTPSARAAALSRDARRIAWNTDTGALYIAALNVGSPRVIHDPRPQWQPDWSPDGSAIASYSDQAGTGIQVRDLHTGEITEITHPRSAFIDMQPDWSPDGTMIVFARNSRNGSSARLLEVPSSGGLIHDITPLEGNYDTPRYSPDGKRMAFGFDCAGDWNLYTMDLRDGSIQQLTSGSTNEGHAEWSPNGRDLLYSSGAEDGSSSNLRIVTADGGGDAVWQAAPPIGVDWLTAAPSWAR